MDGAPVMRCLDPVHHGGRALSLDNRKHLSRYLISHGPPFVDAMNPEFPPLNFQLICVVIGKRGFDQRLETEVIWTHHRLEFATAFDSTAHEICDFTSRVVLLNKSFPPRLPPTSYTWSLISACFLSYDERLTTGISKLYSNPFMVNVGKPLSPSGSSQRWPQPHIPG